MIKIDCFGDMCPVPLIKLQNQLKDLKDNETMQLVVDHSCVVESIQEYYKNSKHHLEITEVINGVWEVVITKNKLT